MPETKDFGPLFVAHLKLQQGSPFMHVAPFTEIEGKFRAGKGLITKIWPGVGVVLGWWGESLGEDEAMRHALSAREEEVFDLDGTLLSRYGDAPDYWIGEDHRRDAGGSPAGGPHPGEGKR